jgi:hypothetical protein
MTTTKPLKSNYSTGFEAHTGYVKCSHTTPPLLLPAELLAELLAALSSATIHVLLTTLAATLVTATATPDETSAMPLMKPPPPLTNLLPALTQPPPALMKIHCDRYHRNSHP